MLIAASAREAQGQLDSRQTDALAKTLGIPPRPPTLAGLQAEIGQDEPDFRRIAALVADGVALTAAPLRVVNPPAFAVSRRIATVDQALSMLGLKQVGVIVTACCCASRCAPTGRGSPAFGGVCGKRAYARGGGLTARSRGLPQTVCLAVRLGHDDAIFLDSAVPEVVARLIAMGPVTELAIQRFAGLNSSTEWDKGGDQAAGALMLDEQDHNSRIEPLIERFAFGTA